MIRFEKRQVTVWRTLSVSERWFVVRRVAAAPQPERPCPPSDAPATASRRARRSLIPPLLLVTSLLALAACSSGGEPVAAATTVGSPATASTAAAPVRLHGGYLSRSRDGAVYLRLSMLNPTAFQGTAFYRLRRPDGSVEGGASSLSGLVLGHLLRLRFGGWQRAWHLCASWSGAVEPAGSDGVVLAAETPAGHACHASSFLFWPASVARYRAWLSQTGLRHRP